MPVGLEKLLRCGKCQQQYDLSAKRPKLLVCHHCFCMQCIQSFIKTKSNQTASCPTCSKATCIGRNGVAALPDNEYLLPQLRAEAKAKKEQQTQLHQQQQQQENIDPATDIFCSDSEEEEGYLDEATGGGGDSLFFNGSIAAASGVSTSGE